MSSRCSRSAPSPLDPSNPKNVWVGTGESWTRNSVSIGDGIYKSTDGGETWTHAGLPELGAHLQDHRRSARRRHRLRVRSGQALERLGRARPVQDDRWRQELAARAEGRQSVDRAAAALRMDPNNPDVLFAGLWDFRRKGWTFRSGGEGPEGTVGQRLVPQLPTAAGPGTSSRRRRQHGIAGKALWAHCARHRSKQCEDGLRVHRVHRLRRSCISHDGGATWEAGDKSQWMVWRPFYFANLIVDPKDEKRVYKTDGALILSEDGGKSFSAVGRLRRHARRCARCVYRPHQLHSMCSRAMTADCGSPSTAQTNGGRPTTCRSPSSTM